MTRFFMSNKELAPRELAALSGVSPDVQRDWRRHGHMGAIGCQNAKGRWVYDYTDAYMLFLMRRLNLGGIDLALTYDFMIAMMGYVSYWSAADQNGEAPECGRFALIRYHHDRGQGENPNAHSMKIVQQMDSNFPADGETFITVDLLALAKGLPFELREQIKEASKYAKSNGEAS